VSWYQKGKTNLDFTEARDSEWQWHQLGHMQGCISLQTNNHASNPPLSFLQAGCPSCLQCQSTEGMNIPAEYHKIIRTVYVTMQYEVEGPRPRGRPKKTRRQVIKEDCQARKLNTEDAMDRSKWRKLIKDVR